MARRVMRGRATLRAKICRNFYVEVTSVPAIASRSSIAVRSVCAPRCARWLALVALGLGLAPFAGGGGAAAQIPGALNATLTASPSTVQAGHPDSGQLTLAYAAPETYAATPLELDPRDQSGSAGAPVTVVGQGASSASWLDAPLRPWNSPGMAIPAAPPVNQSGNDSFCNSEFRGAENANDSAITAAGWRLFGSYKGGWGVYIAGGEADEDGMCRPLSYNYFVFFNGAFAGTISPTLMDSRTDGAAGQIFISTGATGLTAGFASYAPSDPLCCPSATTEVTYHFSYAGNSPALVPDNASTTPNS